MIRTITGKHLPAWKHNWIDQNNVVVGYSDGQQCCERFGWGVYDPETRKEVSDDPDDLPYHFGEECDYDKFNKEDADECEDINQVELLPDDGVSRILVLEFYNCHNGYYYHDFSIGKMKSEVNHEAH